jgi:hypothetical protein
MTPIDVCRCKGAGDILITESGKQGGGTGLALTGFSTAVMNALKLKECCSQFSLHKASTESHCRASSSSVEAFLSENPLKINYFL